MRFFVSVVVVVVAVCLHVSCGCFVLVVRVVRLVLQLYLASFYNSFVI